MASCNIEEIGGEAKSRYSEKLKLVHLDLWPYQIPADSWKNNPTKWSALEYPDIYHYLVETPGVFTRETMKNKKSLEAHNQFISGWVRTVYHYQKTGSNFVILKAEVMPSQRLNEDPHVPWIVVNSLSTMIETAHCTCMAGLGESCSHIGAILWRLQLHKKTCTDEVCKWNQDFVKKTKPELIAKINFCSSKAVEKY